MSNPTGSGPSEQQEIRQEFVRGRAQDLNLPDPTFGDDPLPIDDIGKPRSLWQDAWADLRRNPLFIVGSILVLVLIVMAVFPQLFTNTDERGVVRLRPAGL